MNPSSPRLTFTVAAAAAAALIGALGLTSYQIASRSLRETVAEANGDRAHLISELVERELEDRLSLVTGAARDEELRLPTARRDSAAVKGRLAALLASAPDVDRACLANKDGRIWVEVPEARGMVGMDISAKSWFMGVERSSSPFITEVYERLQDPKVPVVTVAAPISEGGRLVGIIAHQYRTDSLERHIGDPHFGRGGRIYLMDHQGTLVIPRNRENAERLEGTLPFRGALAGRTGLGEYTDPTDGQAQTVAYRPARVGGRLWAVVVQMPASEAVAPVRRLGLRIALATLLAALIAVTAAAMLVRAREREVRLAAEVEQRGRRLEEQTRELSRSNADLEQFAYLASHDLQAPLRSLRNYCEMFQDRCGATLNDEGRRLVGLTKGSVDRMQRMVSDLLEFSRLGRDKGPARPVTLSSCLDDALADLASETARRRAIVERSELPSVRGHAGEVTRLLQNLLSNAMKYCEAEPRIKVGARRDGDFWEVSVSDNGIGVPEEKREAVFGLFERLHTWERFEGSGIGLAACRKIVERHGGRIWLEPVDGKGTVVKFTLPA